MLHSVIMAGGSGTRFWPQSRRARPKQFLPLSGSQSMLQATYARVDPLTPADRCWVVTGERHAELTRKQLPHIPESNVLIEPCGRNTAPCIGLAAIHLLHQDADAVMAVMPADHVIGPDEQFQQALSKAAQLVSDEPERLVLFGVRPSFPATGFGYIERGSAIPGNDAAYRVARFREKPDEATARSYVESGKFYWNCGIFVWRAERILAAICEYEPELGERLEHVRDAIADDYDAALAAEFPQMPSISIDNAVLERAEEIVVMEAPFEWDDIGSWQALARLNPPDEDGNTVIGSHVGLDTRNCIIRSSPEHLVATIGVDDLIIVHTPEATLIARKDDENAVKRLVERLSEQGDERFL